MTDVLSLTDHAANRRDAVVEDPAWRTLKDAVEQVRTWQLADGSIDLAAEGAPSREAVTARIAEVATAVEALSPRLPHDAAYHRALVADLRRWADAGFGVPDFLDSLLAFQPAADRADGRHLTGARPGAVGVEVRERAGHEVSCFATGAFDAVEVVVGQLDGADLPSTQQRTLLQRAQLVQVSHTGNLSAQAAAVLISYDARSATAATNPSPS